jgi:hypothetical protein
LHNARKRRSPFAEGNPQTPEIPDPVRCFSWHDSSSEIVLRFWLAKLNQKNQGNNMNKPIGIALLAVGVLLIAFGLSAADSIGSDFSRFFTGHPTDKSMRLLLGGVASLVVGGVMALRPAR